MPLHLQLERSFQSLPGNAPNSVRAPPGEGKTLHFMDPRGDQGLPRQAGRHKRPRVVLPADEGQFGRLRPRVGKRGLILVSLRRLHNRRQILPKNRQHRRDPEEIERVFSLLQQRVAENNEFGVLQRRHNAHLAFVQSFAPATRQHAVNRSRRVWKTVVDEARLPHKDIHLLLN